jgi:hypothetical protein
MQKLFSFSLLLLVCVFIPSSYSGDTEPQKWTENMQELSKTLTILLPAIYSNQVYQEQKDKEESFSFARKQLQELHKSKKKFGVEIG